MTVIFDNKKKSESKIGLASILALFISSVIYGIGCFIMAHFIFKYW